jgi:hypothetical protein
VNTSSSLSPTTAAALGGIVVDWREAASLPTLEVRTLSPPAGLRLARYTAAAALMFLLLAHLGLLTFADPDMWHEMALAREIAATGTMPLTDSYAYTPTVAPVVHHEWGTGAVLYAAASFGGAPAVMLLKYALTFGAVGLAFAAARRRGASWETIFTLAPAMILAGVIGFTTVRAQLFTLFFLAWLLYELTDEMRESIVERSRSLDAAPPRAIAWRRLLLWAPIFVVWLNVHAGFVVGAGIAALHATERLVRRQSVGHWTVAGIAMAALVSVNPYGTAYYGYLLHGLTMPRPLVTEWQPLWSAEPTMFRVYLISLFVVLYVGLKLGWRRLPGLAVVLITAYLALRHTRHVSLYFIVWMSLVPGYVERTPLGTLIRSIWLNRRRWVAGVSALIAGFALVQATLAKPWRLVVPATVADEGIGRPVYPVGAVDYLRAVGFRGNLFTPFVPGGYCLYQLAPQVKVSLDGRYEVAYQPGVLEENVDFYAAGANWRDVLAKYPTDVVLAPRSAQVTERLARETNWKQVYADPVYVLFARPGLDLPSVEHAAAVDARTFP